MIRKLIAAAGTVAVLVSTLAAASSGAASVPAGAGGGAPDPADFAAPTANPYFPLDPGTVSIFHGTGDGERWIEHVRVTDRTKEIQGVTTTVIRDVIRSHGVRVEVTDDWYAADNSGNVWYFGEATTEYDRRGNPISTAGSWEAGVDGAVAGIIMPADPQPTDAFRQEFYLGEAEDQGWVVHRGGALTVPYGRVHQVLRTFEWSRLEPRVMVAKLYAPGLGIVREFTISGPSESLSLVDVR